MDDTVELWEEPQVDEVFMIAGWRQWADAGSVSSALPRYLVEQLGARQIGRLRPSGFYLFQLPGMYDLLRPRIKLEDGRLEDLEVPDNQIYYWDNGQKGLVIFAGDEPHLDVERYGRAFFDLAERLKVRRLASIGGVYAPVPYDRSREFSCSYSPRSLRRDLDRYAVTYASYTGGTSINSYLLREAERRHIEYFVAYAMVPLYDLTQLSPDLNGIGLEEDYRAWHELMGRLNHMFNLGLDLSDLLQRSEAVVEAMADKLRELEHEHPDLAVRAFVEQIAEGFTEHHFAPLRDIWEGELRDLFDEGDPAEPDA